MPQNRWRMGPSGQCVCPKCGRTITHQPGMPCQQERCPACGARMMREGSPHHELLLKKKELKKGTSGDSNSP
jgi:predicted amidophosphoribosyltransferase